MSGFRTLFLIVLILGNMFLVLHGYEVLLGKVQGSLTTVYDNPSLENVLSCDTENCDNQDRVSRELDDSLREIRAAYRSVLSSK